MDADGGEDSSRHDLSHAHRHRRDDPVEQGEGAERKGERPAELCECTEARRRGIPAAELLGDLAARLRDHLDDDGEPEGGNDQQAGSEDERDVEQLAA
jgi:hypothetical protein